MSRLALAILVSVGLLSPVRQGHKSKLFANSSVRRFTVQMGERWERSMTLL